MPAVLTALPGVFIWVAIYWSIWMDTGITPLNYIIKGLGL